MHHIRLTLTDEPSPSKEPPKGTAQRPHPSQTTTNYRVRKIADHLVGEYSPKGFTVVCRQRLDGEVVSRRERGESKPAHLTVRVRPEPEDLHFRLSPAGNCA